jgi:hypothetical protein
MNKNPPAAPQKAPPKFILPSSRFYPNNNNNENLNNEPVETMSDKNLERLVKETLNSPGNTTNPKYSPSILNLKVPKMKLPNHLRGGKRKTHRKHSTKRKALRKTRKH